MTPRDEWDEVTLVDATVQHHPQVATPTLLAIGLGAQLAELERICAESQRGKHSGESILTPGHRYHVTKAFAHARAAYPRDADSGARHLIHAAARLLMAAACADAEGRP